MEKQMRGADQRELSYLYWPAAREEKVLQIVHGASEHAGRYDEFARWLNERGVSVYALDNRGHGKNHLVQGYVHIDPEHWHFLVDDVRLLGEQIQEETGKVPYLLGHSMGSFIARNVALEGGVYRRFFFTGTGWQPNLKLKASLALTDGRIRLYGLHYQDPLSERLSFEAYRRVMVKKGYATSSFGWLSTDEKKLEEAKAEEALRERFSLGAFKTLLLLVKGAQDKRRIHQIEAPVHFFSGDRDPVGDFGRGVTQAYQLYKHAPVPVFRHIYPGMHHEILNERERLCVYNDLYYFMQL